MNTQQSKAPRSSDFHGFSDSTITRPTNLHEAANHAYIHRPESRTVKQTAHRQTQPKTTTTQRQKPTYFLSFFSSMILSFLS